MNIILANTKPTKCPGLKNDCGVLETTFGNDFATFTGFEREKKALLNFFSGLIHNPICGDFQIIPPPVKLYTYMEKQL